MNSVANPAIRTIKFEENYNFDNSLTEYFFYTAQGKTKLILT